MRQTMEVTAGSLSRRDPERGHEARGRRVERSRDRQRERLELAHLTGLTAREALLLESVRTDSPWHPQTAE